MRFKKVTEILTEGSYKSYKVLLFISAFFVFLGAFLVTIFRNNSPIGVFIEGVSIESFGMLFDILVLGLIFHYYSKKGEEKRRIERYLEELDDYRGWDEKEAMYRIVGHIKRLVELKQVNLPLENCFLRKADLSFSILLEANLKEADLRGAKLIKTNLSMTKLQGSNFVGADLLGAKLEGANFHGAELMGAKGLTVEMLLEVKTLYQVKNLEPGLEKKLRAKKPELFEKPKE